MSRIDTGIKSSGSIKSTGSSVRSSRSPVGSPKAKAGKAKATAAKGKAKGKPSTGGMGKPADKTPLSKAPAPAGPLPIMGPGMAMHPGVAVIPSFVPPMAPPPQLPLAMPGVGGPGGIGFPLGVGMAVPIGARTNGPLKWASVGEAWDEQNQPGDKEALMHERIKTEKLLQEILQTCRTKYIDSQNLQDVQDMNSKLEQVVSIRDAQPRQAASPQQTRSSQNFAMDGRPGSPLKGSGPTGRPGSPMRGSVRPGSPLRGSPQRMSGPPAQPGYPMRGAGPPSQPRLPYRPEAEITYDPPLPAKQAPRAGPRAQSPFNARQGPIITSPFMSPRYIGSANRGWVWPFPTQQIPIAAPFPVHQMVPALPSRAPPAKTREIAIDDNEFEEDQLGKSSSCLTS